MNDALQECSQLKTENTEQEAQLATEQHSYNQESAAFLQEMEMCHHEQSQFHECQSELRNFQRLFRIDAVTDKTWMGHLSSDFSHKLKKEQGNWLPVRSRAAPQNQFFHCWHCGLKCYLSMSCMNYKCSMNKMLEQERKLQEENTMRLKEELPEAQAEATHNRDNAPSNTNLINRLKEEVRAAEEVNTKQDSYMKTLSDQTLHMETEAQEYSKHIVDYVKEIAELKKKGEDLEVRQEEAYSSISEQNEVVREMVLKENRQKQELHQQTQQVLTLKQIIMDNRKRQEQNEKEVQDLRDHLHAMQERMAALGIEDEKKIQEENDKELAQAIHISEQLAAGQGTKQPTTPPLPPPPSAPTATPPPPSPTAPSPKAVPSPKASPKEPPSERASEREDEDPDNLD